MRTTLTRSLALSMLSLTVVSCAPVGDPDGTAAAPVVCSGCDDDGSGASGDGTTTTTFEHRNLLGNPGFDNVVNGDGWTGEGWYGIGELVTAPVVTAPYAKRFHNVAGYAIWQRVRFPSNSSTGYVRFFGRAESSGLNAGDPDPYVLVEARAISDTYGPWVRLAQMAPPRGSWRDSGFVPFSYGPFRGRDVEFRIRACAGPNVCTGRLDRGAFIDAVTFAAKVPTGSSP